MTAYLCDATCVTIEKEKEKEKRKEERGKMLWRAYINQIEFVLRMSNYFCLSVFLAFWLSLSMPSRSERDIHFRRKIFVPF